MNIQNQLPLFINKIQQFEYPVNGIDPTWQVLFECPKEEWQYWSISQYQQTFTIYSRIGAQRTLKREDANDIIIWDEHNYEYPLEEAEEELLQKWAFMLQAANSWLDLVRQDWIISLTLL